MTAGSALARVKAAWHERRSTAGRAWRAIEAIGALASLAALTFGVVNHFESGGIEPIPGEGKRIVAFRQVTNRICTEHRQNLQRALAEARNRLERLTFISRAMEWDVNDLESITPPPSRTGPFLAEVSVRRRAGPEVFDLMRAIELHHPTAQANAIAKLEGLEAESRELSQAAGIVRCIRILPATVQLIGP
ncbi:MAG: hypothetical protein H0X42_12240 [Solirubrobacterales bacterium]|nr:hypothetical protein [Solirubrobacterales bacterium]